METWELVGAGNKPAEEVCLERLLVGVKSLVGLPGFKVIIWGRTSYKGEKTNFCMGGMTPLDSMGLSHY